MESMLKFLDWDSQFFEKKIYRLDISKADQIDAIKQLDSNFDGELIYLFSKEDLNFKNNDQLLLADKKIVFEKVIIPTEIKIDDSEIISVFELTDDLLDLAFLSGHHSRFKLDSKLQHKFKSMYRIWIEKSLTREIAHEVFAYRFDNKNIGFVTVKRNEDSAVIGLIAVSEHYHGKNIGSALMKKVEEWCGSNGVKHLEVATQLDNVQACNFYKKNGFNTKQIDYIYHYYL